MAQDSLRRLASDLKNFLAAQDEDEFILTAAPKRAAAVVSPKRQPADSLPQMPEGETLTVEFARARQRIPAAPEPQAELPANAPAAVQAGEPGIPLKSVPAVRWEPPAFTRFPAREM